MKNKKIKSVLLVLILFVTFGYMNTAFAQNEYSYIPINCDCWLSRDGRDATVTVDFYSNVDKPVIAFECEFYLCDPYGRTVGYGKKECMAYNFYLGNQYDRESYSWTFYIDEKATRIMEFQITSVAFADGSTWFLPDDGYYQEADFMITNSQDENGAYIVDEYGAIHIYEMPCSAMYREWYVWDGVSDDIVWASDDIDPTLYIHGDYAGVVMTINGDKSYYQAEEFAVVRKPYVSAVCYNNYDNETVVLKDTFTSDAPNDFQITGWMQDYPFTLGLWDNNEFGQTRAWYIWSDDVGDWVWFSSERGPICEIWNSKLNAIKLVYNNGLNYSIFTVQPYGMNRQ